MPALPPVSFLKTLTATDPSRRIAVIDMARGVALLAMVVYHASWDLTFLGFAHFDLLGDPVWLAARTTILGSFLLLSGVSLVLATGRGLDLRRFFRRLLLLVAAAGAVSAGSVALFPDSPIFFGVLHHIALASLIGLGFVRLPWAVNALAGVLVIAAGKTLALPLFDAPWLQWVGLMTFEPDSNDYVPLFPWFGAFLFGIAVGKLWRPSRFGAPHGRLSCAFAWAGRHSLAIYLIHQPLLFGGLSLAAMGVGIEPPDVRSFLDTCTATCENSGGEPAHCLARCRCVSDELGRNGLWDDFINDRLDRKAQASVGTVIEQCSAPN